MLFQIIKTPSVIFLRKNDSPLKDGAESQIEFDIDCGQGRALSLRDDIKFNLLTADNNYIFVSLFGGSKPPPYRVGYIFRSVRNTNFCGLCAAARVVPTVLYIKFTSQSLKRFCHKHGIFGRVGIKIFSKSYLGETAFSVKSDCVFVRLSHFKCYKLGIFFTADLFKML